MIYQMIIYPVKMIIRLISATLKRSARRSRWWWRLVPMVGFTQTKKMQVNQRTSHKQSIDQKEAMLNQVLVSKHPLILYLLLTLDLVHSQGDAQSSSTTSGTIALLAKLAEESAADRQRLLQRNQVQDKREAQDRGDRIAERLADREASR